MGPTWMSFWPNSLARLCESARRPCLPAEKAAVVLFPRIEAVAPVKMRVPFFWLSNNLTKSTKINISSYPNKSRCTHDKSFIAKILSLANANAAVTFVSNVVLISSSVISKNGFQTPAPAFHTLARMSESFQWSLMDAKTSWMSEWV